MASKFSARECIPIEYIEEQIEEYRKFDHLGMYAEFLDMFIQDYKDNAMANYADRKTENCSEKPNNCESCRHYNPDHEAIACERCLEGKYSRYEPKTEPLDKDTNVRSKAVYDKWGNVFDARADIEDEPQTERRQASDEDH